MDFPHCLIEADDHLIIQRFLNRRSLGQDVVDGAHDVPRGHLGRRRVHRYPFAFQEELVEPAKLRQVPQRAGGLWAVLLARFGCRLAVIIQFAIGAAESINLYKVRLLQLRLVAKELKLAAHHDALSAVQHPHHVIGIKERRNDAAIELHIDDGGLARVMAGESGNGSGNRDNIALRSVS